MKEALRTCVHNKERAHVRARALLFFRSLGTLRCLRSFRSGFLFSWCFGCFRILRSFLCRFFNFYSLNNAFFDVLEFLFEFLTLEDLTSGELFIDRSLYTINSRNSEDGDDEYEDSADCNEPTNITDREESADDTADDFQAQTNEELRPEDTPLVTVGDPVGFMQRLHCVHIFVHEEHSRKGPSYRNY